MKIKEVLLPLLLVVMNPLAKMAAKLAVSLVAKTSTKEDDRFLVELAEAILKEAKPEV